MHNYISFENFLTETWTVRPVIYESLAGGPLPSALFLSHPDTV